MAERRQPVARVRLHQPGRRYLQRYDGFGHHTGVAEAWRRGELSCNTVTSEQLVSGAGVVGLSPSYAAFVPDSPDMDLMVCRPLLDAGQSIGSGHFDFTGGQWQALPGLGIGAEVRLYQYDGRTSQATGAVSRFTLPRNPVVCLSLHRWAPSPTHPWSSAPPCTEIQLGAAVRTNGGWCCPTGAQRFFSGACPVPGSGLPTQAGRHASRASRAVLPAHASWSGSRYGMEGSWSPLTASRTTCGCAPRVVSG